MHEACAIMRELSVAAASADVVTALAGGQREL